MPVRVEVNEMTESPRVEENEMTESPILNNATHIYSSVTIYIKCSIASCLINIVNLIDLCKSPYIIFLF